MKIKILAGTIAVVCGVVAIGVYNTKKQEDHGVTLNTHKDLYQPYIKKAKNIVSKMTLDEKIGQMIVPTTTILIPNPQDAKYLNTLSDKELIIKFGLDKIKKYHIGSVLVGGNDVPFDANDPSLKMWQKIARLAKSQYSGPKGTELLLGTDEVHGNQHVLGSPLFPQNIGLGATHNPKLVREAAKMTAAGTLKSGFNWVYAPTVAIAHDYRWGRAYESFSQDPDVVKTMAYNFVQGMQDVQNKHVTGTLATVKHFIADGRTINGLDEGNAEITDFDELWKTDGAGYRGAINANAGSMMPSYSSLNGIPMHFGGDKGLLKKITTTGIDGYKFDGFVVSDYAAISKAQAKYNMLNKQSKISFIDALSMSINNGVDMIMFGIFNTGIPNHYPKEFLGEQPKNISKNYTEIQNKVAWPRTMEGYNYSNAEDVLKAIKFAVTQHKIPMSRVDQAVTRIIAVKLAMKPSMKPIMNEKIKQTALEAAEQSLVLLKNKDKTLPVKISKIKNVVLMGAYDDIGRQNGGWTILWQGFTGNRWWMPGAYDKEHSGATSTLDGLKSDLPKGTRFITNLKENKLRLSRADTIAVIVLSENPYAEYHGDVANNNPLFTDEHKEPQSKFLGLKFSESQATQIKELKAKGIPIITVIQSGRPMVITAGADKAPLQNSDALIAAWLPGTSGGQAIANTITGKYKLKSFHTFINGKQYSSNTLPFAWPKDMHEVRNHNYSLFKEGYGLNN
ncbi:glycoside hydrolase family 3 protein [Francisella sp. Scap27]|uniref:glycoside hydrolase family 3 protein n=1 Tax=Francisella sp. Scap27 TaxID=2589986 RepID=UPI0015B88F33|nr:glycoside hydrolase family 3 protein [Francisella sp. Scap27]QLE79740.1 glycoside hydrolase family 3 protein [Francisella sp. Scap27]